MEDAINDVADRFEGVIGDTGRDDEGEVFSVTAESTMESLNDQKFLCDELLYFDAKGVVAQFG